MNKLKVLKLNEKAVLPSYAKEGDAGLDLTAISVRYEDDFIEYGTGIALEIPEGFVGLLFPRSSVSKTDIILANCVGVIDSSYRGEILLRFKIINDYIDIESVNEKTGVVSGYETDSDVLKHRIEEIANAYPLNSRVGQLILIPIPTVKPEFVESLSLTERSTKGFGSTGN